MEKRQTYEELVTIAMQTKNEYNKKKAELQALKNDLEEKAPLDDADLKAKLEELPDDIHEARAALEEIQEKIDSCHYDPNVERQYDQVVAELEREQDKLDLMQGNKDSLVQAIEQIREPWESALVNSISEVNELFVNYMSEMGYTGEVRLKKGEESEGGSADFKNWGIEIRVSFREGVKAQILSAQVQ